MPLLPPDHDLRMNRVRLALDGLSVGDALGERFFNPHLHAHALKERAVPDGPWRYSDDTEMALGVAEVLERLGRIDQDELATVFARRYLADNQRGYGPGMHRLLPEIARGASWRDAANNLFRGTGSMGNGSAMRVAPVGAYFADDLDAVVNAARASAEVTHSHPEGVAGAIAVAVATACAWQGGLAAHLKPPESLFDVVLAHTPPGMTRDGLIVARSLPDNVPVEDAAFHLGNGSRVTAPDTVPFCVWCAFNYFTYPEAIWQTISVRGDIDTNCAIVGGIKVMKVGRADIPADWLAAREPLQFSSGA